MGDYNDDRQEYIPASRVGRPLQRPLSAHVSNRPLPPPGPTAPVPKTPNYGNAASPYRRISSAAPYRPTRPVSATFQAAPVAAWGDAVPQYLAGVGSLPGLFSGMEPPPTYQRPDNTRSVPAKEPENMEEELRKMRLALGALKEQNRLLRTERQRLEEELTRARTNLLKAEELLNIREKALSPTIGLTQMYRTPETTALVARLKEQVKTLRAEKERFKGDLEELLKTTKATRVAELQSEAHTLSQELSRQLEMSAIMRYRMEEAEALAAAAQRKAEAAEALAREYTEAGSTLPPGPVRLSPGNTISSGRVRKTVLAMQQSHRVLLSQAALLRAVFPPGLSMEALAARAALKAPTAGATEVLRYLRYHLNKLHTEMGGLPGGRWEDDLDPATAAATAASVAPKPPRPRPKSADPTVGSKPAAPEPSSDPSVLLQGLTDLVRELRAQDMDSFMARPDLEAYVDQLADVAALMIAEHKRLTGAEPAPRLPDEDDDVSSIDNPLYQLQPKADEELVPREVPTQPEREKEDSEPEKQVKEQEEEQVKEQEEEAEEEAQEEADEEYTDDFRDNGSDEVKPASEASVAPDEPAPPESVLAVEEEQQQPEPEPEPELVPPPPPAEPEPEPIAIPTNLVDDLDADVKMAESSAEFKPSPPPLCKDSSVRSVRSNRSAPDTPVKRVETPSSSIVDPAEYGTRCSSVAGSMYSSRGWQPGGSVLAEEEDELPLAEIAVAAVAAVVAEEEEAAAAKEAENAEQLPAAHAGDDPPTRTSELAAYSDLGPSVSDDGRGAEPTNEQEEPSPINEQPPLPPPDAEPTADKGWWAASDAGNAAEPVAPVESSQGALPPRLQKAWWEEASLSTDDAGQVSPARNESDDMEAAVAAARERAAGLAVTAGGGGGAEGVPKRAAAEEAVVGDVQLQGEGGKGEGQDKAAETEDADAAAGADAGEGEVPAPEAPTADAAEDNWWERSTAQGKVDAGGEAQDGNWWEPPPAQGEVDDGMEGEEQKAQEADERPSAPMADEEEPAAPPSPQTPTAGGATAFATDDLREQSPGGAAVEDDGEPVDDKPIGASADDAEQSPLNQKEAYGDAASEPSAQADDGPTDVSPDSDDAKKASAFRDSGDELYYMQPVYPTSPPPPYEADLGRSDGAEAADAAEDNWWERPPAQGEVDAGREEEEQEADERPSAPVADEEEPAAPPSPRAPAAADAAASATDDWWEQSPGGAAAEDDGGPVLPLDDGDTAAEPMARADGEPTGAGADDAEQSPLEGVDGDEEAAPVPAAYEDETAVLPDEVDVEQARVEKADEARLADVFDYRPPAAADDEPAEEADEDEPAAAQEVGDEELAPTPALEDEPVLAPVATSADDWWEQSPADAESALPADEDATAGPAVQSDYGRAAASAGDESAKHVIGASYDEAPMMMMDVPDGAAASDGEAAVTPDEDDEAVVAAALQDYDAIAAVAASDQDYSPAAANGDEIPARPPVAASATDDWWEQSPDGAAAEDDGGPVLPAAEPTGRAYDGPTDVSPDGDEAKGGPLFDAPVGEFDYDRADEVAASPPPPDEADLGRSDGAEAADKEEDKAPLAAKGPDGEEGGDAPASVADNDVPPAATSPASQFKAADGDDGDDWSAVKPATAAAAANYPYGDAAYSRN